MMVFLRAILLLMALFFLLCTLKPAGVLAAKLPTVLARKLGNMFSFSRPATGLRAPVGRPQRSGGPSRPALNSPPHSRKTIHKGILRRPGDTHAHAGRRVKFAEYVTIKTF
ncbi:uncharacterized protein LOC142769150 [Rhipicephalus microplus]|uniref:uncharacterized protein LOC142769150 n=1 Tax=Rhipicephalus microplus TaxID=6941 RepID=UPI003F6AA606